jgi:hypothetical protein
MDASLFYPDQRVMYEMQLPVSVPAALAWQVCAWGRKLLCPAAAMTAPLFALPAQCLHLVMWYS